MKRMIRSETTVKTYRNKRNPNKKLEVHEDGYGHRSAKQYMHWNMNNVTNPTGDGNLHRWRKGNMDELLGDYEEEVDSCSDMPVQAANEYAHERDSIEQYIDELLDSGEIDEARASAARSIEWKITAEDAELILQSDMLLDDVSTIEYAVEVGESAGFDGAYEVKYNSGDTEYWGWYFNDWDYYIFTPEA